MTVWPARKFLDPFLVASTRVALIFVIVNCQVIFLVLFSDQLVSTYSGVDRTQVIDGGETGGQAQVRIKIIN